MGSDSTDVSFLQPSYRGCCTVSITDDIQDALSNNGTSNTHFLFCFFLVK